jgi:Sigma-70 region 2
MLMRAWGQTGDRHRQDALYAGASTQCAAVIRCVVRGYEADPDNQKDLLQEIHIELCSSLGLLDSRCSLRTWTYRIAHNVGASHVAKSRRLSVRLVDFDARRCLSLASQDYFSTANRVPASSKSSMRRGGRGTCVSAAGYSFSFRGSRHPGGAADRRLRTNPPGHLWLPRPSYSWFGWHLAKPLRRRNTTSKTSAGARDADVLAKPGTSAAPFRWRRALTFASCVIYSNDSL